MANYPLSKTSKQGNLLHPQHTFYSEEYTRSACDLYLTEEYTSDTYRNIDHKYRLHASKPHNDDMALAYDIQCPTCSRTMKQVGHTLNYYDLGAYKCPVCDKR